MLGSQKAGDPYDGPFSSSLVFIVERSLTDLNTAVLGAVCL